MDSCADRQIFLAGEQESLREFFIFPDVQPGHGLVPSEQV